MENFSGVNGTVGAHAEVADRNAKFSSGFRSQVALGAALFAAAVALGWLFLSGPSDRDIINDRLADVGVTATYVGEAADDGHLFIVDRACGDQITVTITVRESQLDRPRPVTVDEPGGSVYDLADGSVARLVNC